MGKDLLPLGIEKSSYQKLRRHRRGRYIRYKKKSELINNNIISVYCLVTSFFLIAAAFAAAVMTGEGFRDVMAGFSRILFSPAKFAPDYFELGGLAATCLNAGLCGLGCSLLILINRTPARSIVFAGYFLVISHSFFGLNFLNMWPCFLGVVLYSKVRRVYVGDNLGNAMFATALGPFVSEFFFCYPFGQRFVLFGAEFSVVGVVLGLLASVLFGFMVPALMVGTSKMQKGFSLYKAGLAIGLFGIFMYAVMFKTMGLEPSEKVVYYNAIYESFNRNYSLFINLAWGGFFLATAAAGVILCKGNLKPYLKILKTSGHDVDFCEQFGMKLSLINVGVYGLFILLYYNLVILLTDGAGFTGNTAGVIFAAISFALSGQHPRNVYPIMLGYAALSLVVHGICFIRGSDVPWTLSTQAYLVGLAFATGLCPFAGKYGVKVGMAAGALSAIICTSTAAMHGGLMLYNGGFTAGLTALLLVPILDFYHVKEKDDAEPTAQ